MKFDPPVPDGIYLGMSDEEYFGQEAIGSSDLVTLAQKRHGWWWASPYNPDYKRNVTPEMEFGSALHAMLLEGPEAYAARYAVEPDKNDYADLCVTIDDIKGGLRRKGFAVDGISSKWTKADWCRAAAENAPDIPVWDNLMSAFKANLGAEDDPKRKKAISAADNRILGFMRDVAIGEFMGNEDIKVLFTGEYPPLTEVAIFTTENGIRRRRKLDAMFPKFDMDLKTIGNWTGRPLPHELGDHLARKGWDQQRADYFHARRMIYAMIRAVGPDVIHGGTKEQRTWLASFPERFETWDWVWLAYQKPNTAGRAPVIIPIWDDSLEFESVLRFQRGEVEMPSPSFLRRYGDAKNARALAFYTHCVSKFGLHRPWADIEQTHYTDQRQSPHLVLPHWIEEEAPTTEAAYAGR